MSQPRIALMGSMWGALEPLGGDASVSVEAVFPPSSQWPRHREMCTSSAGYFLLYLCGSYSGPASTSAEVNKNRGPKVMESWLEGPTTL